MPRSHKYVRYCEVSYCGQKDYLIPFPSKNNKNIFSKWNKFVLMTKKNFAPNCKSSVCYRHFTPDCFHNYGQVMSGFSNRLSSVSGSYPTIHPPKPPTRDTMTASPSFSEKAGKPPSGRQTRSNTKTDKGQVVRQVSMEDYKEKSSNQGREIHPYNAVKYTPTDVELELVDGKLVSPMDWESHDKSVQAMSGEPCDSLRRSGYAQVKSEPIEERTDEQSHTTQSPHHVSAQDHTDQLHNSTNTPDNKADDLSTRKDHVEVKVEPVTCSIDGDQSETRGDSSYIGAELRSQGRDHPVTSSDDDHNEDNDETSSATAAHPTLYVRHRCQDCSYTASSVYSMKIHSLTTGHNNTIETATPSSQTTTHPCGECGMLFHSKLVFDMHLKSHKVSPQYAEDKSSSKAGAAPVMFHCPECDFRTNQIINLQVHMKQHLHCSQCGYKTDGICDFEDHMNTHVTLTTNKDAKCDFRSDEISTSRERTKTHKLLTVVQDKRKDDTKDKMSQNYGDAKSSPKNSSAIAADPALSVRNKADGKSSSKAGAASVLFHCPDCDFRTNEISNLQEHIKTHSGGYGEPDSNISTDGITIRRKHVSIIPKPTDRDFQVLYKCPDCIFETSHIDDLQEHMIIHT